MLLGTRCRWLSDEEQNIPAAACVACAGRGTNPCGYPLPLIKLMVRDRDPQVVQCSSTMIPGCPREHGLKKRVPYYVRPDRAYTRAYGSLVHLGAELLHKGEGSAAIEQRYERPLTLADGRVVGITSQVDCMYVEEDGVTVHLKDYKVVDSLAESKLKMKATSYVPQFSVQRWVLEASGFHIATCNLLFLHQKNQRVVNLYPDGEQEFPDAYLWDSARTERYLQKRLPALVASLDGQLAAPLTDDLWRCGYCDVHDACAAAWQKESGQPLPADAR